MTTKPERRYAGDPAHMRVAERLSLLAEIGQAGVNYVEGTLRAPASAGTVRAWWVLSTLVQEGIAAGILATKGHGHDD